MQLVALGILALALLALIIIQYAMIITDIRNNRAKTWEIIVGLIPLGPYILMILTGIWHIVTIPTRM